MIDAVEGMLTVRNGSVKRGAHQLAEEASLAFEEARGRVAAFVGADPGEVVWTSGSTQALNLLAYVMSNVSAGRGESVASTPLTERLRVGPGDSIVTTRAEHHANLVPWQELCARTGASLRWIDCDERGRLDPATLSAVDETTKLVAFAHVSNVTGAIAPVTLDTWAKATSLVVSSTADKVAGSRRPLSSQSIHRRLAPVRAHSSCHGTRLAWCSARVVTIESPGPTRRRSVSGVLATLSPRPAETFDMT